MKYLLKPLIMYPSLMVEISEHIGMGTVLSLQTKENLAERPAPADVYAKIILVLKTLHKHLFGILISAAFINFVSFIVSFIWVLMNS